MADVLLTVSGVIASNIYEQVSEGKRPRADYLELARTLNADLLDYPAARRATGRFGILLERLAGADTMLAWACFRLRRTYRTIFTDGEQVGIPFALMSKLFGMNQRAHHVMIVHILSVKKKMVFFDYMAIQSHIDRFLVYSTWQKQFIEQRWSIASERVIFTPFMVDEGFFDSAKTCVQTDMEPIICAVGLEARDYPTLLDAVKELPVQVVIAAASPWSKRSDEMQRRTIPANVQIRKFSQYELRQLYADARFMVMPLQNVEFQAGVTAILEAMAMERAVICSRTPGQTDVVVEGETGLYVPPNDAITLRKAIVYLLTNADVAQRLGKGGRKRIEQSMSLDHYIDRLNQVVCQL